MVRESDIEDYLIRQVDVCGGEVRKVKWIGRRNAPDRLVLLPYFHPLVELKAPGEHPTPAQVREHERLRKAGMFVYVVDSYADVDRMLEGRHA